MALAQWTITTREKLSPLHRDAKDTSSKGHKLLFLCCVQQFHIGNLHETFFALSAKMLVKLFTLIHKEDKKSYVKFICWGGVLLSDTSQSSHLQLAQKQNHLWKTYHVTCNNFTLEICFCA